MVSRRRMNKATDTRFTELEQLVANARDNESTLRRFQTFELKLMSAPDVRSCVRLLLNGSRQRFSQDATSLFLVDSDHAIRRGLASMGGEFEIPPNLHLVTDEFAISRLFDGIGAPRLATYDSRIHHRLFSLTRDQDRDQLASVCQIPFMRGSSFSGCLNLASRDPDRFRPDVATDFLAHLGAVAAVSFEAVVARHQLHTMGLTDALTGVNNRRFFDQRLEQESSRARRESIPLSLVFIDVDHFKQVNDQGGHAIGDRVLRDVASAVLSQVRVFDIVSRFGGDEFAVLLIGATRETALEIGERIRVAVEATGREHASQDIPAITASIGIATIDRSRSLDADKLLESADRAVYEAKASGRNRLVTDCESPSKSSLPPYLIQ